jgi:hypothetical protein
VLRSPAHRQQQQASACRLIANDRVEAVGRGDVGLALAKTKSSGPDGHSAGRCYRAQAAATSSERWDERSVAIGIAGSGRVGTIALQECDRRPAGAVGRSRTAEFGRIRKSGGDTRKLRLTAAFSFDACSRTGSQLAILPSLLSVRNAGEASAVARCSWQWSRAGVGAAGGRDWDVTQGGASQSIAVSFPKRERISTRSAGTSCGSDALLLDRRWKG